MQVHVIRNYSNMTKFMKLSKTFDQLLINFLNCETTISRLGIIVNMIQSNRNSIKDVIEKKIFCSSSLGTILFP